MTVLRLEVVTGGAIEAALGVVAAVTLARRPEGAFASVGAEDAERLIRALAFAGITTAPSVVDLTPPSGAHGAVGRDLTGLRGVSLALDLLELRRIALGEATRAVLVRRLPRMRRPSRAQRERCEALLHERDVAFAWRRRAWGARVALRSAQARASLRPVLFDGDALTRRDDERIVFASERLIGPWLF